MHSLVSSRLVSSRLQLAAAIWASHGMIRLAESIEDKKTFDGNQSRLSQIWLVSANYDCALRSDHSHGEMTGWCTSDDHVGESTKAL